MVEGSSPDTGMVEHLLSLGEPRADSGMPLHDVFRIRLRKLSVILPFYNEAQSAEKTAAAVIDYATKNPQYQFVLMDDGSTDQTAEVLEDQIQAANPLGVALIRTGRNQGKGRTIKSALVHCTGDGVCFLDGDLAYSLDHLELINSTLCEYDVVIGSRIMAQGRGGSLPRRLYGSGFNYIVRRALGLPFRDTQAGLKGFRREVAEHLFSLQRLDGFGFDAELLFLARKFGYRIAEIPARLNSEHAYKTTSRRLVLDAARVLREVLEVRRNDRLGRYSREPIERIND